MTSSSSSKGQRIRRKNKGKVPTTDGAIEHREIEGVQNQTCFFSQCD